MGLGAEMTILKFTHVDDDRLAHVIQYDHGISV
jgi:hypothetical protein